MESEKKYKKYFHNTLWSIPLVFTILLLTYNLDIGLINFLFLVVISISVLLIELIYFYSKWKK
ncbi:hypothetical protein QRE66_27420 (plasmid) [Bacillus cereus]|nr:hypothetical protein QRE66_27420 [Bacillus cereus]